MRRRLVWPVGPLLLSFDCAARYSRYGMAGPGLSNYLICNDGRFSLCRYDSTKTVNGGGVFGKIYSM